MSVGSQTGGTGIITPDVVPSLLSRIDRMWLRANRHKGVLEEFFETVAIGKGHGLQHIINSVGRVAENPRIAQDTDEQPLMTPLQGLPKTFTQVNYRLGVQVTDTMLAVDRYAKIEEMVSGLPMSAVRKREYLRAGILNNAFTGTDGADGKSLIADDHPQFDPDVDPWDNLGTGDLTGSNLQSLLLLADVMKDERGNPDPQTIMRVVVPPQLRQKGLELIGSTLDAETDLNTNTVIIDRLKLLVSHFLTSESAYFGFGTAMGEEKGLLDVVVEEPFMINNNPTNALIRIDKQIKFMNAVGFTVSKNIYASAG